MAYAVMIVEQREASSPGNGTDEISDDDMIEVYITAETNQRNDGSNNDHI